jgi:ribosomal protein S18 acetylase RimI-like enzyme
VLSSTRSSEVVYVSEDRQGEVVGFASGGQERSGDPDYLGELYAIYVRETSQRKGIGRQLTSCFATRLFQDGMQSMLVWVLAENPARMFYEDLGGTWLREQNITIGGTTLVEVAYGWKDTGALANLTR